MLLGWRTGTVVPGGWERGVTTVTIVNIHVPFFYAAIYFHIRKEYSRRNHEKCDQRDDYAKKGGYIHRQKVF